VICNSYLGKLVGTFYNKDGLPTKMFYLAEKKIKLASNSEKEQKLDEERFPNCNSRWTQNEGGEVHFLYTFHVANHTWSFCLTDRLVLCVPLFLGSCFYFIIEAECSTFNYFHVCIFSKFLGVSSIGSARILFAICFGLNEGLHISRAFMNCQCRFGAMMDCFHALLN